MSEVMLWKVACGEPGTRKTCWAWSFVLAPDALIAQSIVEKYQETHSPDGHMVLAIRFVSLYVLADGSLVPGDDGWLYRQDGE